VGTRDLRNRRYQDCGRMTIERVSNQGFAMSQKEYVSHLRFINVASVRHISPFRYPGGKTWLVPTIKSRIQLWQTRPSILIDPFVGGGSVPISLLCEGLVDRIVLGEKDSDVGSVWQCILSSQQPMLCERIKNFSISRENVQRELERPATSNLDRAFQTLLKNRTSRGGILIGSNLLVRGENGRGVASRWYPETLVRRLDVLKALQPFIEFFEMDAFALIKRYLDRPDVAYFIDPPYTAGNGKRAGSRLYTHNEVDHLALFKLLVRAAGLVLMTYDDCPEVVEMAYSHGLQIERVPMKNTHHVVKYELLISNGGRIA
jgi:DNA adenine methylase